MKQKILDIYYYHHNIEDGYRNEDLMAEEIESIIKENYYEKEFMQWLYSQNKKIIVSDKTGIRLKTIYELYDHWNENVKDKQL